MMYPFLRLDDQTEIVYSHMQTGGVVKVYIEKPVNEGFHSAICYLPNYRWEDIKGFSSAEIERYQGIVESVAPLIIEFSQGEFMMVKSEEPHHGG